MLVAFAATGPACRRSSTAASADAAVSRTPLAGECTGTAPLPIAPLIVHAMGGGEPSNVTLAASGEVSENGKIVAHVSGSCILDPRGGVIFSVGPNRVVKGAGAEIEGTFQSRATIRNEDGKAIQVVEVLLGSDGSSTAIAPDGAFYAFDGQERAFSLPAQTVGDVSHARRTALLLLRVPGALASRP